MMIETNRLLIRRFTPEDASGLWDYLSNPAVYRFEPGEPISIETALALVKERSEGLDFLAVELKSSRQLVGHLYFKQIEPPELDTWELGYIFNPRDQNQGYATESAGALVQYGFTQLGVHRVIAHCNPENTASWRVMEKIGMTREGLLRQNIFFRRDPFGKPIWVDTYAYAIINPTA